MKYWLCFIYFTMPIVLLATRDFWLINSIDYMLALVPWVYLSMTSCILQHDIFLKIKYKKWVYNILKETLRWSVFVMLLYRWFNIYMITLIHSIVWVWSMVYILQPKTIDRITYI